MATLTPQKQAGETLRYLIKRDYGTQQDFADARFMDIRTVNRYINDGINKIDVIQDMADHFDVDFTFFFMPHEDPGV